MEDVNQYPADINKATPSATDGLSVFLINKIVNNKPVVAIISLTNKGISPRIF